MLGVPGRGLVRRGRAWQKADVDIGQLSDLCTPWCIHVAATLNVADNIAAGVDDIEGPAHQAGLAMRQRRSD